MVRGQLGNCSNDWLGEVKAVEPVKNASEALMVSLLLLRQRVIGRESRACDGLSTLRVGTYSEHGTPEYLVQNTSLEVAEVPAQDNSALQ